MEIGVWPWPVAQWLEHQPVDLRVDSSVPGQGHIPQLQVQSPTLVGAHAGGNQSMCLSLPLLLPFHSKNQWKQYPWALTGLAQLERWPIDGRVLDLIPVKGTYLSCRLHPKPQLECVQKATNWCVSFTSMFPSFRLYPFLPLSKHQWKNILW